MRKRLSRTGLPIVCLLAASFSASQVLADWSGDKLYKGYNQRFGDFPPADIDKQLSGAVDTDKKPQESTPPSDTAAASNSSQVAVPTSAQGYATQPLQQPAYGNYYQYPNYAQPGYARPGTQRYGRRSNNSAPWGNNRTSFGGPWNNRGSGFSSPWNNRGSGFSGPWNNNGSNFSTPWSNNGSGFRPWGNGGSWSW